ncbi:MAG: RNA-binding domain-containing protein [Candidatus Micrarchaeota archaeon]
MRERKPRSPPSFLKETEILELKRSTSELEEALISIVAILNKHQAGELYFGIKDNGSIVGQDISAKTLRDIAQAIDQKIEPKIFPKINHVEIEGKACVHVQFSGTQVPYFCDGRAYIRVADQDRKTTVHEVRRMLSEQVGRDWEKRLSEKGVRDANTKMLRSFMRHAKDAKRIQFSYTNARTTCTSSSFSRTTAFSTRGRCSSATTTPWNSKPPSSPARTS